MKKTLKALLLAGMMCALFITNALAFTVVESGNVTEINAPHEWAKAEIDLARKAGLLTAHTENYFKEDITRFQFAELVVNLAEKATGKTIVAAPDTTFTDCKEAAVLKAFAVGIVSGVGDNEFDPDQTTNREQIAAMVYRAIAYLEKELGKEFTTKNADLAQFTDKASVSTWAAEGVGVLANNGIMKGTSDTALSPASACPIEQSILLVYRVFNLVT